MLMLCVPVTVMSDVVTNGGFEPGGVVPFQICTAKPCVLAVRLILIVTSTRFTRCGPVANHPLCDVNVPESITTSGIRALSTARSYAASVVVCLGGDYIAAIGDRDIRKACRITSLRTWV